MAGKFVIASPPVSALLHTIAALHVIAALPVIASEAKQSWDSAAAKKIAASLRSSQ